MKKTASIAIALLFSALMASPLWAENFILIQGGAFTMGSPESEVQREKDETPHQVTLNSFYLGKYEVTQKEYYELINNESATFSGDSLPMENVSWYEAIEYCNARSLKEGLTPAYELTGPGERPTVTWNREADGYRLPTEAEWEYACRAGTATPFNTGDNITASQANYYGYYPYDNNPRGEYRATTTPVGSFSANPWGLYDMHGNVWEWCWDCYFDYAEGDQTDPSGPAEGIYKVNRGGGWNDFGRHLRSAYRAAHTPAHRTFNIGFRLARNAD